MNHNTFPTGGEQEPGWENNESAAEILANEPSFEEHMEDIAQRNTAELSKPSLKNAELKDGVRYLDEAADKASEKIKAGDKLDIADITEFKDIKYSGARDKIAEYLSNTGFEDGTDYDIKLPGFLVMGDGTKERTPLSVSFNNGIDFTRIDFYEDADSGEMTVMTRKGEGDEGIDVGYQGSAFSRDYKPRFSETRTFKDGRYNSTEN